MRIANWKAKEVFNTIYERAIENGNEVMDDVVGRAKTLCPVGKDTINGGFVSAYVSFIPKTGRNKGHRVTFGTAKRWTGRYPGQLRDTIRRRTKGGNIRVYAGNFKVYYALFVERGTVKMKAKPFLRPSFQEVKSTVTNRIKNG